MTVQYSMFILHANMADLPYLCSNFRNLGKILFSCCLNRIKFSEGNKNCPSFE